jgi:hypothetical protein
MHVEAVLHGLRMEVVRGRWHGAQLQLARSEPTAVRSEQRPGAHAGENGRWAGCPSGFGPVL